MTPNKQFFNVKFLSGFFGQLSKSYTNVYDVNIYSFCCVTGGSTSKGVLLNYIPIFFFFFFQNIFFMLDKKLLFNSISLESYTPFDFQLVIYSVPVFLNVTMLNVG